MKQVKLTLEYAVFESDADLDASDLSLLKQAVKATANAYVPYSGYRVGAAVRLKNGKIITGNNQENLAYPSGTCAERVALYYAASQYPDVAVEAIAITASSADFDIREPVTPCGSCRQVMAETENRQAEEIKVIMKGETGNIYVTKGIHNILPLMFQADGLKK